MQTNKTNFMQTTNLSYVGTEHAEWKNVLGFYKDELLIFKTRLTEIASKNTVKETMQMVEHFQNQFIIQSEKIDILIHDINEHLSYGAKEMRLHRGEISSNQLSAHLFLKNRFESEQKIFNGIMEEFEHFSSKVM